MICTIAIAAVYRAYHLLEMYARTKEGIDWICMTWESADLSMERLPSPNPFDLQYGYIIESFINLIMLPSAFMKS